MNISDGFGYLTGRQHVNRTAHGHGSGLARILSDSNGSFSRPPYSHKRENGRRRRQIERGMLKVG